MYTIKDYTLLYTILCCRCRYQLAGPTRHDSDTRSGVPRPGHRLQRTDQVMVMFFYGSGEGDDENDFDYDDGYDDDDDDNDDAYNDDVDNDDDDG